MKKEEIQINNEIDKSKKIDKNVQKKLVKKEKKERRKNTKAHKIIKICWIVILIWLIILIAIFAYRVSKNGGGLQGILATTMGHNEYTLKDLDELRFLLIGISGEEDYKLADTIMLCSYNPKLQKASILSIPRDTYVGKNKEKATASYKINSVYRNGTNIDGMVEKVEEITGLEIDNYLVIDTRALRQLVDAIGGVEFDVPIDMQYDDSTQNLHINLQKGYQKLSGQQAEWLVRFRHNNNGTSYPIEYGDNDLGRMRTQREFITQVLKQTLKPENIFKVNQILKIGMENVNTNLSFDLVKDYIPYSVNFKTEELQTNTLPGVPELANDVYIYTVNKKQTKQMIQEMFEYEEETEDGNSIKEENINNNTKNSNTTNTTKNNTTKTNTTKTNTTVKK